VASSASSSRVAGQVLTAFGYGSFFGYLGRIGLENVVLKYTKVQTDAGSTDVEATRRVVFCASVISALVGCALALSLPLSDWGLDYRACAIFATAAALASPAIIGGRILVAQGHPFRGGVLETVVISCIPLAWILFFTPESASPGHYALGNFLASAIALSAAAVMRAPTVRKSAGSIHSAMGGSYAVVVRQGLPLLGVNGLAVAAQFTPLLALSAFAGPSAAAIYATADRIGRVGSVAQTIMEPIYTPDLVRAVTSQSRSRVRFVALRILVLSASSAVLLAIVLVIGFVALETKLDDEYSGIGAVLAVLSAGYLVNLASGPTVVFFSISQQGGLVFRLLCAGTLVSSTITWLLASGHGALAVAIVQGATVTAYGLILMGMAARTIRALPNP